MGGGGGIGKPGPPNAPQYSPTANYGAVASSDANMGQFASGLTGQQLAWAQGAYANQLPYTQNFMNQMGQYGQQAASMQANDYFPVQNQFVQTAMNYNSPQQQAQASSQAQADVANAYQGQRTAALQDLESYGIDPSQTRFGALDLGTRVSQAANMASAGTQARLNSQMTGINLQNQASQMGFTQAGQQINAGSAGNQAGLNTMTTGGNLMGTAPTWSQQAINANQALTGTINSGYQNQLTQYQIGAGQTAQTQQGVGQIAGAAIMAAMLSDRRAKTDIHRIGATKSGIPIVTYRYKSDPKGIQPRVGVIAQDVEKVIPGAIVDMGHGLKGVDYRRLR